MIGLVLGGGGTLGAYQAGVMVGLLENSMGFDGFDWIGGTSIGAVNATLLSQWNKEDQLNGARDLVKMWKSIKRPTQAVGLAVRNRAGLLNADGLERIMRSHVCMKRWRASQVGWSCHAVDITTGKSKAWDKSCIDPVGAALASAAVPGIFVPKTVKREPGLYVDGGVRENAPVQDALDAGCTKVVVILCAAREGNQWAMEEDEELNWRNIMGRSLDVIRNEIMLNDVAKLDGVRSVIIEPSSSIGSPMQMSRKVIDKRIRIGEGDGAREAIRVFALSR